MRKHNPPPEQIGISAVVKRLDILIAVSLERTNDGKTTSMTEKILKLRELGLAPSEIAQILRKPVNYVTASIAMRKKRKKG